MIEERKYQHHFISKKKAKLPIRKLYLLLCQNNHNMNMQGERDHTETTSTYKRAKNNQLVGSTDCRQRCTGDYC